MDCLSSQSHINTITNSSSPVTIDSMLWEWNDLDEWEYPQAYISLGVIEYSLAGKGPTLSLQASHC